MRKQWKDFLDCGHAWSYNIVPELVSKLDGAIKNNDQAATKNALEMLATQGIILKPNGDLDWAYNVIIPEPMTVRQLADLSGKSISTVYRLARKLSRLPTVEELQAPRQKTGRPRKYF